MLFTNILFEKPIMKNTIKILFVINMLFWGFINLSAQKLYQKGDSLEINIDGYKFGVVQWQFSKDYNNWTDIQNANGLILKTRLETSGGFRAKIKGNCNDLYYSEIKTVDVEKNDLEYADYIGNYLASDELRGRRAWTAGDTLSAYFIANLFKESNLTPLNSTTFYKPFINRSNLPTFNVIGLIPGNDPILKNEVIVISGHYDHLGANGKNIFNGADDNASGAAGVCVLARNFKDSKQKRTLLFITPGAEETLLEGTTYFIKSNEVPVSTIKYVFNFDMIGRLRNDSVFFYGTNFNIKLIPFIQDNNTSKLNLAFPNIAFFPGSTSDHALYTNYNKNCSSFGITTGKHNDYHKTTDDWNKINVEGLIKITDLTYRIIAKLANDDFK